MQILLIFTIKIMPNDEVFQEYKNSIQRLQVESSNAGITKQEFEKTYSETLKSITKKQKNDRSNYRKIYLFVCILIILVLIAYNFKYLQSFLICNIQEYIYPGLRLLRKASIPLISLFPSLTDFYQETCLIQNPFFTIVDMDCWPCSTINNIGEVYDPQPIQVQHTAPFIYKSEQKKVTLNEIKKMYNQYINIYREDQKVLTDNKYYQPLSSIFDNKNSLYIWKINNINVARSLRKLIPRPKVVPKFGQSIERFVIIDSKHDLFHIPDTECHYSFLLVTQGQRIINLKPAEECKHQCKILKVELKESYLLWYNWWYWRPTVQETSSNETFIAHVGSYC